jgi:hypothetical protein
MALWAYSLIDIIVQLQKSRFFKFQVDIIIIVTKYIFNVDRIGSIGGCCSSLFYLSPLNLFYYWWVRFVAVNQLINLILVKAGHRKSICFLFCLSNLTT